MLFWERGVWTGVSGRAADEWGRPPPQSAPGPDVGLSDFVLSAVSVHGVLGVPLKWSVRASPLYTVSAMAATARREIDTGEEDIAAIAKQISDHAEAIYQTWKARGLAPTEILSCRPTPGVGLKLGDLRTKPKTEPKPEIKQRPDIRRELRPEVVRDQRLDARREQRSETRREHWQEPEEETIEVTLPPDLVPERNGTTSTSTGARRADPAAMRLEVAREEERLLRALRTGGVVAERTAERPDVVPPISLVDYAKSRYQDRLDSGARKPSTGASGERRASLGSHVTEARSKFEARARRASSAGAGEPATAAGATPVRPFLTRGSVAERVLMFERCPSEATLELAKRKSPAATTWRGPHDVINRAQVNDEMTADKKENIKTFDPDQIETREE
ncbi:unnamed protein product [Diatraea saccharalis]|uniref:Uncharacterized protein n=1 Tax=Diatraea saccharalis TaxID=40085 RepID=A0A9N9N564_9NEOP|nr:unnamed protein product [Diatraea saccharalis]